VLLSAVGATAAARDEGAAVAEEHEDVAGGAAAARGEGETVGTA